MSHYTDIGGECFAITDSPPTEDTTNDTKTYDLVCKSKTEFYKVFRDIIREVPDTIRLFRAYLPYGKPQLKGLLHSDKEPLKKVIQMRRDMLRESINSSNQTIKNIQFVRYYDNLGILLKSIDEVKGTSTATSRTELQSRIKKLSRDRIFYILLEMAWKLIHPDKIETGTEDTWMNLLNQMDTLTLGNIVESIQGINDPSKFRKIVDIEQVAKATDTVIHAASPPDDAAELRRRLEAILQVLVIKKYLKAPLRGNTTGPAVNNALIAEVGSMIPETMNATTQTDKKVGGASASLYESMGPYYEFFEKKYEPITSVLAKAPAVESISLTTLSHLLFICEKIASRSPPEHGIYRISHLDNSVLEYLHAQLGTIRAHLDDPSITDEQKKAYLDAVELIPIVSITSLLNKFGKSGHYNDPQKTPRLQIMMVGYNLNHYATNEDMTLEESGDFPKEQIFDATKEFFTPNDVYLVCTDSTRQNIPMNLFEIDDMRVDVVKNSMNISEIKDNYFNKYKQPAIYLENVMKIETDTVYPHGMLALSMFMASRELLPK
jgi:hypothetical protein